MEYAIEAECNCVDVSFLWSLCLQENERMSCYAEEKSTAREELNFPNKMDVHIRQKYKRNQEIVLK